MNNSIILFNIVAGHAKAYSGVTIRNACGRKTALVFVAGAAAGTGLYILGCKLYKKGKLPFLKKPASTIEGEDKAEEVQIAWPCDRKI